MNSSPCCLILRRMFSRCRSHLRCRNPQAVDDIWADLRHTAFAQVLVIFTMVAVSPLVTKVGGQELATEYGSVAVSKSKLLIDQSRLARQQSEKILAAVPHLVQRQSSFDETLNGIDAWIAQQAASFYSIEFELDLGAIFEREQSKKGQDVDTLNKYPPNENRNPVQVDRKSTFHPTVFAQPVDRVEPARQKKLSWNQVPIMKLTTKNDRLVAVANNLVELGHYTAAGRILEKVLQTEKLDPLDYTWVLFQLARCERKMKDPVEAEKWLRLIGRQGDSDIVSESAEWWLEQQDRRRRLEEGLEMVTGNSDR